jgi:periplasmic divalent cation tolerance protein
VTSDLGERLVVLSTAPDGDVASELAMMLVEARLAACVNVMPAVESIYRWEGKTCRESEVLMLIKTTAARLEALTAALAEAHPYECPEVVALPVRGGLEAYLDWVTASVDGDSAD